MEKVNLAAKFGQFSEQWSPKIVGQVNDMHVKLARLQGEFVWHHHDDEDEMFLVVKGHLTIRLRDRDIHLEEGEFLVIPHGVEHLPVAEEEAQVMLFEPVGTLNTGNVRDDHTVETLDEL